MNPGAVGRTVSLSATRAPEGSHHRRCGMSSSAFMLPRPPPTSGATPGHAQPPRTGAAQAGGHQHARRPRDGQLLSPAERTELGCLTGAGPRAAQARRARPDGPHSCRRARDELSIVVRPRGATGVPSMEGRAAARRRTVGLARWALHRAPAWAFVSDVHAKISQTVPRQRMPKAPCQLGHPSLPGGPAAELALAGFSSAPCGGLPGLWLSSGLCLFCT